MFVNHFPITYDADDGTIKQIGFIYFDNDVTLHKRIVENKDMVKR